jgi:hypothetical protein
MFIYSLLLSLLLASCSSWSKFSKKLVPRNSSRRSYTLKDISGKFRATREVLYKNKHTRLLTKIMVKDKTSNQELEKTLSYSKVEQDKSSPLLSQHTIWLEKQRFFSQIKYIPAKKSFEVSLKSPEDRWNGRKLLKVPESRYTCFFSQIANCIQNNGILDRFQKDADLEIDITVIWDNYPFYAEQYIGLREEFYSAGSLRIDGLHGNMLRVALEIQDQIVFYTFDEKFEFQNIYWIAQGYTLERKVVGED